MRRSTREKTVVFVVTVKAVLDSNRKCNSLVVTEKQQFSDYKQIMQQYYFSV